MPDDGAREDVEKIVKHYLGKVDDDVVSLLLRGYSKGYDKRKLKDRLADYVKDDIKLTKIAERTWDLYEDLREYEKSRKRPKADSDRNGEPPKKRKFEEDTSSLTLTSKVKKEPVEPAADGHSLGNNNAPADGAPKAEAVKPEPAADGSGGPPPEVSIKDIMAQAQRAIEERKKALNLQPTPAPLPLIPTLPASSSKAPSLSQSQASMFLNDAMEKQTRAAQLRERISAKLPALLNYQSFSKQEGKPVPLMLDASGKTIDATGREIQLIHRMPTLKANIRAEKRDLFQKATESTQLEVERGSAEGVTYFDPRVVAKGALRKRRQLKFHDKGTFEKLGQRLRAKVKLEKLQQDISQAAKRTGISSAVKLAIMAPKPADLVDEDHVPSVEWWDSLILPGDTYELDIAKLEFPSISRLVEHPAQMKPADYNPNEPECLKVYLTTKERKKLRRQNRKEAMKEATEKIRLGLEAPPEPKVKISNLMRVLGSAAVQDPTKMEAHVREQMAKRLKKHEDANAARKLTPAQRKEKNEKKIKDDVTVGIHVAVYRVVDMNHPARKFKVEMNAKQLYMTGIVVLHKDVNVIVFEGGPKQQKFMKNLMLRRIKWNEETKASKEATNLPKVPNKCTLVWEGTVKERAFSELKFKLCPLEKQAREQFQQRGVEHYWDAAFSGAILEQAGEDD